jgi:short-subunit dehydrogenase
MPASQGETAPHIRMAAGNFALISGASSGIGACFARALAARGKHLVLVARSRGKLETLARELKARHDLRIEVIPQDLSLEGAASHLVSTLIERGVAVDLLVNNAGFGAQGEFWKLPLERQSEMLRLNVLALVELTYLLLPGMVQQCRGGVINVSSTAGFQPVPYTTVYSASKAFVTSFSMALEEELRRYGVKVVTLCPGGTKTGFFDASRYRRRSLPGGLQAPEKVVEEALRALERGGGLVVPRWLNKLSIQAQRRVPRRLVVQIAGDLFRPPPPETGV